MTTKLNADEIANIGVDAVKSALLDYLPEEGVRSLVVNHYDDGPQIRFSLIIDGRPVTFAAEVEPFLPVGGDN